MFDALRIEARVDYDLLRAHLRGRTAGSHDGVPIVLNSLPKSGTHLAIKLLEHLPGICRVRLQLSQATRHRYRARGGESTVDLGIVWPVSASRRKVYRAIRRIPPGAFVTGHIPHDPDLSDYLRGEGTRMIVLTRDPRDVALSGARYVASSTSHPLHERFAAMTEDERLMATIVGITPEQGGHGMRNLRERVSAITSWQGLGLAQVVRYEDLVGPMGGGTASAQHASINRVANHVGVSLAPSEVGRIAGDLYGGTPTFRKGRTGSWREQFRPAHLAAAGPLIQDLLVELGYEDDESWWR